MLADCVNSSPPLISRKFPGIRWNFGEIGEIREISGKLRGTQRNSVGFCMPLSMNSVEHLEFGAVSGDLGPQKAFAQIATACYNESQKERQAQLLGASNWQVF